jgi:hypothetical protein
MSNTGEPRSKKGLISCIWTFLWSPSSRFSLGTLLIAGGIGDPVLGRLNPRWEVANTEHSAFRANTATTALSDLQQTIHFKNRSGVRAKGGLSCSTRVVLLSAGPGANELLHKKSWARQYTGKIRAAST